MDTKTKLAGYVVPQLTAGFFANVFPRKVPEFIGDRLKPCLVLAPHGIKHALKRTLDGNPVGHYAKDLNKWEGYKAINWGSTDVSAAEATHFHSIVDQITYSAGIMDAELTSADSGAFRQTHSVRDFALYQTAGLRDDVVMKTFRSWLEGFCEAGHYGEAAFYSAYFALKYRGAPGFVPEQIHGWRQKFASRVEFRHTDVSTRSR